MKQRRILTGFLNHALHQRYGVAIWFMPGKSGIQVILSKKDEIKTTTHFSVFPKNKGFVFAPFQNNDAHKTIFLQPGKAFYGFEDLAEYSSDKDYNLADNFQINFVETTKEEHLSNCNEIIRRIKQGEAEKVVLSRIKSIPSQKHPSDILLQMKAQYPDAFCYLFFTPQTGLWMGATPETLIHAKDGKIETMALAGTRKHHPEKPQERPWPVKEQQEQAYVTEYIRNQLEELSIHTINISEPYTARAGSIEHIRTDFVIDTKGINVNKAKIIDTLHPTPAVCGHPKENALQIIKATERHNRAYYTGFLGPFNDNGETSLFVNLRCMKNIGENYLIFAGGGITADSDAEAEWEETEMKAAVVEKVLNKA